MTGCADTQYSGGTVAIQNYSPVQGRDWGRGGATAGGISSLEPGGNAADWSVYQAREMQRIVSR